ncbi:hypothetical protein ACFL5G_01260 [Candidatus Margulisiibacteriota bacterium]
MTGPIKRTGSGKDIPLRPDGYGIRPEETPKKGAKSTPIGHDPAPPEAYDVPQNQYAYMFPDSTGALSTSTVAVSYNTKAKIITAVRALGDSALADFLDMYIPNGGPSQISREIGLILSNIDKANGGKLEKELVRIRLFPYYRQWMSSLGSGHQTYFLKTTTTGVLLGWPMYARVTQLPLEPEPDFLEKTGFHLVRLVFDNDTENRALQRYGYALTDPNLPNLENIDYFSFWNSKLADIDLYFDDATKYLLKPGLIQAEAQDWATLIDAIKYYQTVKMQMMTLIRDEKFIYWQNNQKYEISRTGSGNAARYTLIRTNRQGVETLRLTNRTMDQIIAGNNYTLNTTGPREFFQAIDDFNAGKAAGQRAGDRADEVIAKIDKKLAIVMETLEKIGDRCPLTVWDMIASSLSAMNNEKSIIDSTKLDVLDKLKLCYGYLVTNVFNDISDEGLEKLATQITANGITDEIADYYVRIIDYLISKNKFSFDTTPAPTAIIRTVYDNCVAHLRGLTSAAQVIMNRIEKINKDVKAYSKLAEEKYRYTNQYLAFLTQYKNPDAVSEEHYRIVNEKIINKMKAGGALDKYSLREIMNAIYNPTMQSRRVQDILVALTPAEVQFFRSNPEYEVVLNMLACERELETLNAEILAAANILGFDIANNATWSSADPKVVDAMGKWVLVQMDARARPSLEKCDKLKEIMKFLKSKAADKNIIESRYIFFFEGTDKRTCYYDAIKEMATQEEEMLQILYEYGQLSSIVGRQAYPKLRADYLKMFFAKGAGPETFDAKFRSYLKNIQMLSEAIDKFYAKKNPEKYKQILFSGTFPWEEQEDKLSEHTRAIENFYDMSDSLMENEYLMDDAIALVFHNTISAEEKNLPSYFTRNIKERNYIAASFKENASTRGMTEVSRETFLLKIEQVESADNYKYKFEINDQEYFAEKDGDLFKIKNPDANMPFETLRIAQAPTGGNNIYLVEALVVESAIVGGGSGAATFLVNNKAISSTVLVKEYLGTKKNRVAGNTNTRNMRYIYSKGSFEAKAKAAEKRMAEYIAVIKSSGTWNAKAFTKVTQEYKTAQRYYEWLSMGFASGESKNIYNLTRLQLAYAIALRDMYKNVTSTTDKKKYIKEAKEVISKAVNTYLNLALSGTGQNVANLPIPEAFYEIMYHCLNSGLTFHNEFGDADLTALESKLSPDKIDILSDICREVKSRLVKGKRGSPGVWPSGAVTEYTIPYNVAEEDTFYSMETGGIKLRQKDVREPIAKEVFPPRDQLSAEDAALIYPNKEFEQWQIDITKPQIQRNLLLISLFGLPRTQVETDLAEIEYLLRSIDWGTGDRIDRSWTDVDLLLNNTTKATLHAGYADNFENNLDILALLISGSSIQAANNLHQYRNLSVEQVAGFSRNNLKTYANEAFRMLKEARETDGETHKAGDLLLQIITYYKSINMQIKLIEQQLASLTLPNMADYRERLITFKALLYQELFAFTEKLFDVNSDFYKLSPTMKQRIMSEVSGDYGLEESHNLMEDAMKYHMQQGNWAELLNLYENYIKLKESYKGTADYMRIGYLETLAQLPSHVNAWFESYLAKIDTLIRAGTYDEVAKLISLAHRPEVWKGLNKAEQDRLISLEATPACMTALGVGAYANILEMVPEYQDALYSYIQSKEKFLEYSAKLHLESAEKTDDLQALNEKVDTAMTSVFPAKSPISGSEFTISDLQKLSVDELVKFDQFCLFQTPNTKLHYLVKAELARREMIYMEIHLKAIVERFRVEEKASSGSEPKLLLKNLQMQYLLATSDLRNPKIIKDSKGNYVGDEFWKPVVDKYLAGKKPISEYDIFNALLFTVSPVNEKTDVIGILRDLANRARLSAIHTMLTTSTADFERNIKRVRDELWEKDTNGRLVLKERYREMLGDPNFQKFLRTFQAVSLSDLAVEKVDSLVSTPTLEENFKLADEKIKRLETNMAKLEAGGLTDEQRVGLAEDLLDDFHDLIYISIQQDGARTFFHENKYMQSYIYALYDRYAEYIDKNKHDIFTYLSIKEYTPRAYVSGIYVDYFQELLNEMSVKEKHIIDADRIKFHTTRGEYYLQKADKKKTEMLNALKAVEAAEAAGLPTQALIDELHEMHEVWKEYLDKAESDYKIADKLGDTASKAKLGDIYGEKGKHFIFFGVYDSRGTKVKYIVYEKLKANPTTIELKAKIDNIESSHLLRYLAVQFVPAYSRDLLRDDAAMKDALKDQIDKGNVDLIKYLESMTDLNLIPGSITIAKEAAYLGYFNSKERLLLLSTKGSFSGDEALLVNDLRYYHYYEKAVPEGDKLKVELKKRITEYLRINDTQKRDLMRDIRTGS